MRGFHIIPFLSFILVLFCCYDLVCAVTSPRSLTTARFRENRLETFAVRGGEQQTKRSRNKKKKKKPKSRIQAKSAIDSAIKEKDAADVLGDAIRDRADILRNEDPLLQSIDWSISSLGSALGASDRRHDGGGVEAAKTSVLANYFLKSHGGAHGFQCLCSFLATSLGISAIIFNNSDWSYNFLRRSLMFAMTKHVSGLLAAASIAAKAIPQIGLSQARQWMEQIVLDPVSQYVFYTAVLLFWLPSKQRLVACWWWPRRFVLSALLGPILFREVISNILIVSDVLVLWRVGNEDAPAIVGSFISISQAFVNAIMSLAVSPQVWRSADPSNRQAILARLVGRASLILEVFVGLVLVSDLLFSFVQTTVSNESRRGLLQHAFTRILCVRLYIHFLWVRRRKIGSLAAKLRGGATELPIRILDFVHEPGRSMGLETLLSVGAEGLRETFAVALGLD